MGINNAENGIDQALVNEVKLVRQDMNDFRTNPQRIGTGSINLAYYGDAGISWSAFTIAAGSAANFVVTLAVDSLDARPAYDLTTLMNVFVTVRVDVDTPNNRYPDGPALAADQQRLELLIWYDLEGSGLSINEERPGGGARKVFIRLRNSGTSSHTYYVRMNAILPWPALKKL